MTVIFGLKYLLKLIIYLPTYLFVLNILHNTHVGNTKVDKNSYKYLSYQALSKLPYLTNIIRISIVLCMSQARVLFITRKKILPTYILFSHTYSYMNFIDFVNDFTNCFSSGFFNIICTIISHHH